MGTDFQISEATQADLPEMIALCCEALEPDVLTRFLYGHKQAEAVRKQSESLTASLGKRFTHPTNRCYIHKAVNTTTGAIFGWSLVRWEDGSWGKPVAPPDGPPPDFATHYTREVKKNWIKLTGEKPVVVLGALYVRTDQQGRGIGTKLIENLYSKYELDNELVLVQTRAMSEGFYQRLRWKTVDSTDVDLSEWGGKGRGYGVHRSPQMLREPSL